MTTVNPSPAVMPIAERNLPVSQLVLWSDWQEVFPQNWKRISNRKLNEACEQVEVIYGLDFEFESLFDAAGKSLFFVDMHYDAAQQRIYQGDKSFALEQKKILIPETTISKEEYWLEGAPIKTLSDFIDRMVELNRHVPVWKPKVWKTLAELKEAIESHTESA